jgi:hypothetical protein
VYGKDLFSNEMAMKEVQAATMIRHSCSTMAILRVVLVISVAIVCWTVQVSISMHTHSHSVSSHVPDPAAKIAASTLQDIQKQTRKSNGVDTARDKGNTGSRMENSDKSGATTTATTNTAIPGPSQLLKTKRMEDPCHGYDGVLLIQQGDRYGAAATIFFLFVLNQLLYADRFNLLPWIHLNDYSQWVYDPMVHGKNGNSSTLQTFQFMGGMQPVQETLFDPSTNRTFVYPGRPMKRRRHARQRPQSTTVEGTGVWNTYFSPVSPFDSNLVTPPSVATSKSSSCHNKPLVTLPLSMIIPALHIHCPWSVRAWRYGGLPAVLQDQEVTLHDWLGRHRRQGAAVVSKYYQWQPALQQAADRANPAVAHVHSSSSHGQPDQQKQPPRERECLALHVRHSDKGNRRRRIPLESFLPFVEAYVELTVGGSVYLATDSSSVLDQVQQTWPKTIVERLRTQGARENGGHTMVRSPNSTAVFKLGKHDQTNFQVLTDIAAMSHCQFLLHGLSAVSEAVHYWNPALHEQSVNLDDPQHMLVSDFRQLVQCHTVCVARSQLIDGSGDNDPHQQDSRAKRIVLN